MASPITYSLTKDVRSFAWFVNNNFILDTSIDLLRTRAKARINTAVGSKYLLPISDVDVLAYLWGIEILLAGGMLLWQEYGKEAIGTDKDGAAKIREGESMLREITEGKVKLIGADGVELPGPATWSIKSGLPLGETDVESYFTRDISDI